MGSFRRLLRCLPRTSLGIAYFSETITDLRVSTESAGRWKLQYIYIFLITSYLSFERANFPRHGSTPSRTKQDAKLSQPTWLCNLCIGFGNVTWTYQFHWYSDLSYNKALQKNTFFMLNNSNCPCNIPLSYFSKTFFSFSKQILFLSLSWGSTYVGTTIFFGSWNKSFLSGCTSTHKFTAIYP